MRDLSSATGLVGVGYQGSTIQDFVARLVEDAVARVVDVRLTPVSRQVGFSRTRLAQALADVGIAYEHRPELGNPKADRASFHGSAQRLARAREVYASRLADPAAAKALSDIAAAAAHERVAVLCFEADQEQCHRAVVLAAVARLG